MAYEGESIYNYLQVKENEERVILSTNVLFGVQSVYEKNSDFTKMYYDYAMMAPYMANLHNKEKVDVLVLGMGTGTYASQCDRFFDNIEIEGVEIDQKITDLAREHFNLSENINVTTYDGRAFLQAVDKKYDVIMVDAYQDISIPFQMSSVEFFTMVKEHLTEAGTYRMTDDSAPVELLSMQVIDELIQDEVSYYKKIYNDRGIQGLMDELL